MQAAQEMATRKNAKAGQHDIPSDVTHAINHSI
jgi:hypothetical protein